MTFVKEGTMELLDRYLEAVRKHLPWQRQDDIIAELRANLEAQLEEKEDELGRPFTKSEIEDWLKSLGNPMRMAAPYQPQQYLIGPALFPIFRNVLKIALAWTAVIYCIVCAVDLLVKTAPQVSDIFGALVRLPLALLTTATWVTLIFAAVEFANAHGHLKLPPQFVPAGGWSPADLPGARELAHGHKKPKSFAAAAAEVIFGFFWLVWFLLVPAHPFLMFGPGIYYLNSLPYKLAPIWVPAYWCLVALNMAQLVWNASKLSSGTWQLPSPAAHLVFKVMGITPVILLLFAPNHAPFLLKDPLQDSAVYATKLMGINHMANLSLGIVCAIAAVTLAVDVVRFGMESYRKRVAG
jgi:hypothetical protein